MLFEIFDFPLNLTNFAFSKRNNLLFIGLGEKSITSKISNMLNVRNNTLLRFLYLGKKRNLKNTLEESPSTI